MKKVGLILSIATIALLGTFLIISSCKKEEEQTSPQEIIIPCDSIGSFEYGGQIYNAVEIGSQCWMKENLNIGSMILGTLSQSENGKIEKYCYNNEPDSCSKYGGLYQWNEMMQYTTQQGAQGICPPGWHLPTDEEWKVLEGAVDSLYGIGDPEWDLYNWRGYDAGTNLKSTSGWYGNSNGTDLFGFSALPGGFRDYLDGNFVIIGNNGFWWSSTDSDREPWIHHLNGYSPQVSRYNDSTKDYGLSVRCLRDY